MTKRFTAAAAILLVALTGCSSPEASTPKGGAKGKTQVMDVTSGRPLSEFKGSPTYPWRKNLAAHQAQVLERLQGIDPSYDEGEFSDVLNTCMAIGDGSKGPALVKQTQDRFGSDPGQAQALIAVSRKFVCS